MFKVIQNFIILLLIVWISTSQLAFSQTCDTIFIYETEYIFDTVWIELPVKRDTVEISPMDKIDTATLLLDTVTKNASIIYFSSGKSATIPINHILMDGNQLKHVKMKKLTFWGMLMLTFNSFAQNSIEPLNNFLCFLKGNNAAQVYREAKNDIYYYGYPQATGNLPTIGAGIKYERRILSFFSFVSDLSYVQKGAYISSWEHSSDDLYGNEIISYVPEKRNRFQYFSLDAMVKITIPKDRIVEPYIFGGFKGDFWFDKSIEYQIDNSRGYLDEKYSYYRDFNRFSWGYVIGFGADLNEKITVEFELNEDISYLVKNEGLKVWNQVISLNVGININPLFGIE